MPLKFAADGKRDVENEFQIQLYVQQSHEKVL